MAADTGSQPARGLRLRDARIRSKLGLILVVPLVAIITLAGLRLVDSVGRVVEAETVRSLTAVSVQAATIAHELHRERVAAARMLASDEPDSGPYSLQAGQADAAVEDYRQARTQVRAVPEVVATRLVVVDTHLGQLDGLRQQVLADPPLTVPAVLVRYGTIIADVLAYQQAVATVVEDPSLVEQFQAVAAMSEVTVRAAEAHALAQLVAVDGRLPAEQVGALASTQTGLRDAFASFARSATPAQQQVADRVITGGPVAFATSSATALLLSPDEAVGPSSFAGMVATARWVEVQLYDQLQAAVVRLREEVFRQVVVESVAVLLALAIAVTIMVLLARMLARSLGRLRDNALQVAERELPATVARLSDPAALGEHTPAQLAARVREPITLRSRDEIGEVASAFNVVHRTAVRIAAEQAALRTSVATMFLNLARRSQLLVDRMISQLDEIERHEEDPKRLSRMFTLDHLATRMRRNDENLLTLAGADSAPAREDHAALADVLRAAQSEVEQYQRIEFGAVDTDVSITAGAVNDVVRLVAELFDNATRFSPPQTQVVCEARRLAHQVVVHIEDRGVGMSADVVDRINTWLAAPPALEVTTFRKMGLAVVARLASRHGIRVELRCDPHTGGTTAYVALPQSILVLPTRWTTPAQIPTQRRALSGGPPAAPEPPESAAAPAPRAVPAAATAHEVPATWPAAAGLPQGPHRQPSRDTGPQPWTADEHSVSSPAARRPVYDVPAGDPPASPPAVADTAAASPPEPGATVELPIFKEIATVWFRSHGQLDLGQPGPRAGSYPTPPAPAEPARPAPALATTPRYEPPAAAGEDWSTAADAGWQAATAAATPTAGGTTGSGLPKRVPQAQLVPGSVTAAPTSGPGEAGLRRSPDEVRGLLSAYHRGVQRGRHSGMGGSGSAGGQR